MDKDVRPVQNSQVKVRREEFGRLLVVAGLPMLCINEDAAKIWDLCDGKRTVAEIADACNSGNTTTRDSDAIDAICGFLDEAIRLGLIEVQPQHN
jgi:hypothetical protein